MRETRVIQKDLSFTQIEESELNLFLWQISTTSDNTRKNYCELIYHAQKIRRIPTNNIRELWTAVSTLLGLISSVYRNLHHWRSKQWPQIAVPKNMYTRKTNSNFYVNISADEDSTNMSGVRKICSSRRAMVIVLWHRCKLVRVSVA